MDSQPVRPFEETTLEEVARVFSETRPFVKPESSEIWPGTRGFIENFLSEWAQTKYRFQCNNYNCDTSNQDKFPCPSSNGKEMRHEELGTARNDLIIGAVAHAIVAADPSLRLLPLPDADEAVAVCTELTERRYRINTGDPLFARIWRVLVYFDHQLVISEFDLPQTRLGRVMEAQAKARALSGNKLPHAIMENQERILTEARLQVEEYKKCVERGERLTAFMTRGRRVMYSAPILCSGTARALYTNVYEEEFRRTHVVHYDPPPAMRHPHAPAFVKACLENLMITDGTARQVRHEISQYEMAMGAFEEERRRMDGNGSADPLYLIDADSTEEFYRQIMERITREKDAFAVRKVDDPVPDKPHEVWTILAVTRCIASAVGMDLRRKHIIYRAELWSAEDDFFAEYTGAGIRPPLMLVLSDGWYVQYLPRNGGRNLAKCDSFGDAFAFWCDIFLSDEYNGLLEDGRSVAAQIRNVLQAALDGSDSGAIQEHVSVGQALVESREEEFLEVEASDDTTSGRDEVGGPGRKRKQPTPSFGGERGARVVAETDEPEEFEYKFT